MPCGVLDMRAETHSTAEARPNELQPLSDPAMIAIVALLLVEDVSDLCARMAVINRGSLDRWTRQAADGVRDPFLQDSPAQMMLTAR